MIVAGTELRHQLFARAGGSRDAADGRGRGRGASRSARQFFRNAINNGLPAVECEIAGIAEAMRSRSTSTPAQSAVPARDIERAVAALPPAVYRRYSPRRTDSVPADASRLELM